MEEITTQNAIVFGVLAACFAGPAAAIYVLLRRKAKARQSRRSPIGIALLRGPGHSLREQLDETNNDLTWDLVLPMVVPLLALFLAQSHLRGLPQTAHLAPVCALAAIAFIAHRLRKLPKAGTRLDRLKAGYNAEVAVGQELDQLMRQGAATFHDLPAEQFNIDHVVGAAEGAFAVETKGFTRPNQGRGKADATVSTTARPSSSPTGRPRSHWNRPSARPPGWPSGCRVPSDRRFRCCPWWRCPGGSWTAPGAAAFASSAVRNWPAC
jgi:hypothetical protein